MEEWSWKRLVPQGGSRKVLAKKSVLSVVRGVRGVFPGRDS